MANIVKKLKADIIKDTLKTGGDTKSGTRSIHEFVILEPSKHITLNDFQRKILLKALEIYFPQLYVGVAFTYRYDIIAEEPLEDFLHVLDEYMSSESHYVIYGECKEYHYDFLRQLRLKFMTK